MKLEKLRQMKKHKVGDKVVVTNTERHCFKLGQEVIIIDVNSDEVMGRGDYYKCEYDDTKQVLKADQFEFVGPTLKQQIKKIVRKEIKRIERDNAVNKVFSSPKEVCDELDCVFNLIDQDKRSYKKLDSKTLIEWFNEMSDDDYMKTLLLDTYDKGWEEDKEELLSDAVKWAFIWDASPQGHKFWDAYYKFLKSKGL